jgi:hypothetical protein
MHTRKARRHTRHQDTRKRLPMHASTMKGIYHWHTRMFEKLGWMVLAKAKGYDFKVEAYKKSIDHLLKTIDHVSAEYVNQNRKHDLNVLRMNTVCLQDFVRKHL